MFSRTLAFGVALSTLVAATSATAQVKQASPQQPSPRQATPLANMPPISSTGTPGTSFRVQPQNDVNGITGTAAPAPGTGTTGIITTSPSGSATGERVAGTLVCTRAAPGDARSLKRRLRRQSAPAEPADLGAEGEEQRQQREHGDGHHGSLDELSNAQYPCGPQIPSVPVVTISPEDKFPPPWASSILTTSRQREANATFCDLFSSGGVGKLIWTISTCFMDCSSDCTMCM